MSTIRVRRSSRIFFEAIRKNDKKMVSYLLRHGTDVRSRDIDGNSAIHHAILAESDNVEMMELLLEHGAEVDFANYDGTRAYDIAFDLNKFRSLEFLLKCGARIDVDHFGGMLQRAPQRIVDLLYERVNVNEVSSKGLTALHHTVRVNDLEGVRMLLQMGADVNHQEPLEGSTPLYWAKTAKCVEILLQHGAKPNVKHKWDNTLLFNLCRGIPTYKSMTDKEKERIIEMLLEVGADVADSITYARLVLFCCVKDWCYMRELRMLLKFMAKLEHRFAYATQEALKLSNPDQLGIFYAKCLKELTKMRKERVFGDVTYFDITTKSMSTLVTYARNKNVLKSFERKKVKCRMFFPIYHRIAEKCFKEAIERNKLFDVASIGLSMAMRCVDARNVATQRILEYLNLEDLQSLAFVYNSAIAKNNTAKK